MVKFPALLFSSNYQTVNFFHKICSKMIVYKMIMFRNFRIHCSISFLIAQLKQNWHYWHSFIWKCVKNSVLFWNISIMPISNLIYWEITKRVPELQFLKRHKKQFRDSKTIFAVHSQLPQHCMGWWWFFCWLSSCISITFHSILLNSSRDICFCLEKQTFVCFRPITVQAYVDEDAIVEFSLFKFI